MTFLGLVLSYSLHFRVLIVSFLFICEVFGIYVSFVVILDQILDV